MASFIGQDPLNSLTNLYSRPILINALRDPRDIGTYPTSADIQPSGTQWENSSTTPATLWQTSGNGYWYKGNSQNVAKLTGNNSTFAVPDANQNINILGTTGQIDVAGSGSTLTLSLTGGGEAVDSFQPDTGTDPVVPDAAGLVKILGQSTANTSGIRVSGGTNELDIAMFSPFVSATPFIFGSGSTGSIAGTDLLPLAVCSSKIGGVVYAEINNNDNTSNNSGSRLNLVVGGSSAGDPAVSFSIPSGTYGYTLGIDNSVSDSFVLSQGSNLGTNNILSIAGDSTTATFAVDTFSNTHSGVGINVDIGVVNTETANAASSARLGAGVGGASAGDPCLQFSISGATTNKLGLDNSDSDSFVYNVGCNASNPGLDGTTVLKISQAGLVSVAVNTLGVAVGIGGPTITSGSGAPGTTQPKGSLYLRTDGSGVNDRAYIATNSSGTWTAIVTVA